MSPSRPISDAFAAGPIARRASFSERLAMPSYDYLCAACGPFEARAAMADYDQPSACPSCGTSSPRALLTAPILARMDGGRRAAFATNERSADSPRLHSKGGGAGHGPGCGCCKGSGGKSSSGTFYRPDGSKSFPAKRPWMISH